MTCSSAIRTADCCSSIPTGVTRTRHNVTFTDVLDCAVQLIDILRNPAGLHIIKLLHHTLMCWMLRQTCNDRAVNTGRNCISVLIPFWRSTPFGQKNSMLQQRIGCQLDCPAIVWWRTDGRPPTRVFHKVNIYIFIYQYELPSHNFSPRLHENCTCLRLTNIRFKQSVTTMLNLIYWKLRPRRILLSVCNCTLPDITQWAY